MKLTVSLSRTQKAQEVIHDNMVLHRTLGHISTNVWELHSSTASPVDIAEEIMYAFEAAGIPRDEYSIE
ncbi:MAG: hypothetical protein LBU80_06025 [Rikenellaceae bacterium]|jgi:hypothetical protein|nr:hypothetical protein [Rikenellaceae bacterium]